MIFGKLIKQNKISVSYRFIEKSKNALTLMTVATNWKLADSGCENQVNETGILEVSVDSMYSGNKHVLCIGNRLYTMKEILRDYVDLACIKGVEEFLCSKEKIKIRLDKLFREILEYKVEQFNEEHENKIELNTNFMLNECFQEIAHRDEELKSEIYDEFESGVFEEFNFSKYVRDYAKEENYKFEEIEHNKKRLEKLIDLYLWKQEWEGGLGMYKGELEKFITSECKDMTISGYPNGR